MAGLKREAADDRGAGGAAVGRWQRRAARREAERRRIPKHGKAYVTLAEQMLAQRAAGAPSAARRRSATPGGVRAPASRPRGR
jgi:hypothetical protein